MKNRAPTRHPALTLLVTGIFSVAGITFAVGQTPIAQPIGKFTHSKGVATVTHPGQDVAIPINVRDEVFFRDFIRTGPASKTKALFIDDSILTLGANNTMEITEHVYNPDADTRTVSVGLLTGKMRVLVGKLFQGLGSKFEIHTDTAVVAARGTLFDVWLQTQEGRAVPASYSAQAGAPGPGTGVNVHQGVVTVSNGVNTVNIPAGQFTVAFQNTPIPQPQISTGSPIVLEVQQSLDIEETPEPETPSETVENSGQTQTQQVESAQQTSGPTGSTPPAATTPAGTGGDTAGGTGGDTGGTTTTSGQQTTGTTTSTTAPSADPLLEAASVTTVIDPLGIAGENLNNLPSPANIVSGQMDVEMLREQAAVEGGRAPQANVNINVTFPR